MKYYIFEFLREWILQIMYSLLSLIIIATLFCIPMKQYYTFITFIIVLSIIACYINSNVHLHVNKFVLGWSIDGGDTYKLWGFSQTDGLIKPATALFKNGNIFPILICYSKWTFQTDISMRAFELDVIQIRFMVFNLIAWDFYLILNTWPIFSFGFLND